MEIAVVINLLTIVLFIFLIISHLNNRMWSEPDKVFFALLLVCSFCAIADTLDALVNGVRSVPYAMQYANTTGYYFWRNLTPFLYVCYIITLTDKWHNIRKNGKLFLAIVAPFCVAVTLVLSNAWTKIVFYYDETHWYHRGKGIYVLYAIASYYLLLSIVLAWKYKDNIMREKRYAIQMFVVISIFCVGVQAVFPQIRIEMFGTAICVMMIMFTIQRQEEVLDGSTGLWNRVAFAQKVHHFFSNEKGFAVISVNVCNLRVLNETIGRLAVDQLLNDIAQYIKSFHMETSFLYTMGNGKFNIVLSSKKRHLMESMAEKINRTFLEIWKFNNLELQLFVCVAAVSCPEDISNEEDLLKFTDEFHKHMPFVGKVLRMGDFDWKRFCYREELEGIIENALLEKKFEVYFQPIYSAKEHRITSAEALVRLEDDKYGFISPEEFIPVAEANMSILEIDKYVLERVCAFIAANDLEQKGIEYIEVNLSAVQCMQTDMARKVLGTIKKYGIEPKRINLEITESAVMYSPETMKRNMKLLQEQGVEFSLDDYGSGYSNINYLLEFPFSIVKLDRSMVCLRKLGEKKWIALKHSIDMLQEMGFYIVAEGVETRDMADDLIREGCQYLQGYYFSKALPGDKFIDYIDHFTASALGTAMDEKNFGMGDEQEKLEGILGDEGETVTNRFRGGL